MPTDALNFITDGASSVRMRWREPYVTEGINRKMAGVDPRGIYRGFRLNTNVAAMSVTITADPVKTDHLAVYESTTGYSISLRRTGGNFTLSLAAYPATTVYIAIYVVYATLTTTQAVLRVYTAAEYAVAVEKPDLIVLGQVVVPGAGIIADTAIVAIDRIEPWTEEAPNVKQWHPTITNSRLEYADQSFSKTIAPNLEHKHYPPGSNWEALVASDVTSTSSVTMAIQNVDVPYPGAKAMTVTALGVGPNVFDSIVFLQSSSIKLQPGDRIRFEYWYKLHQTPTLLGQITALVFSATDADPPVSAPMKGGGIITLAAPTAWTKVTSIFEVTGLSQQTIVIAVGTAAGITFPNVGNLISLGPWQVWIESAIDDGPEDKVFGKTIPLDVLKIRDASTDADGGWRSTDPDYEVWLRARQGGAPTITNPLRVDLEPHPEADPAVVWTRLQVDAVKTGVGLSGLTNVDRAEQARFLAEVLGSDRFTNLLESDPTSGTSFRIYHRDPAAGTLDPAVCLVLGARWDAGTLLWVLEDARAIRLSLTTDWTAGRPGIQIEYLDLAGAESNWRVLFQTGAGASATDLIAKVMGQAHLGESLAALASNASEAVARLAAFGDTTTATKTLLFEFTDNATPAKYRFYLRGGAFAGIQATYNARWNHGTSLWVQDAPTTISHSWLFYRGSPSLLGVAATYFDMNLQLVGAAPWADTGWVQSLVNFATSVFGGQTESTIRLGRTSGTTTSKVELLGDQINFDGARLVIDESNILKANTPQMNALYSKNIPKAWANIICDGGGAVTLVEGFGIASVSIVFSSVVVTFQNAFVSTAAMAVAINSRFTDSPLVHAIIVSTTQIMLSWPYQTSFVPAYSLHDPVTNLMGCTLVVFGEQS